MRQTDVARLRVPVGTLTFTLDTTAATPGGVAVERQARAAVTGCLERRAGSDGESEVGRDGAVLDRWRDDVDKQLQCGRRSNTVKGASTDVAGNTVRWGRPAFTLDTTAATPGVSLSTTRARGSSDGSPRAASRWRGIGVPGATVQYSRPMAGRRGQAASIAAEEGSNTVKVRRTDVAGNTSSVGTLTFAGYDGSDAGVIAVVERHGHEAAVTGSPRAVCFPCPGNRVGRDGARCTRPMAGRGQSSFSAAERSNTVKVRQTDVAGNTRFGGDA